MTTLTHLQRELRSRWPEWTTIAVFAGIVAFAIPLHEPWADEAQAWQLARSLSLHDLFQTYIRYEATPGLWHFLLWVLIRAHVSFTGLHWICGTIAVTATALLVLKSPFPRYLKLVLPFTYFLLFQYAVVARSYVLVPILLFSIAMCWKKNPWVLALLFGLLANVALHAAVISGGLAIVYFIGEIRNGGVKDPRRRRQLLQGAAIVAVCYAFAIWTAWPPHDLLAHMSFVRGQSPPFLRAALLSLYWGICQPIAPSILFWILIGICFQARRSLFFLLPVLLFAAFCGAVHGEFWHVGLVIPLLLCLMWITWPVPGSRTSRRETAGRAALLLMAGVQVLWSLHALSYSRHHAYSPAPATAQFLAPFVRQGNMIVITWIDQPDGQGFDAVAVLPYFDHNIFANLPDPFWWWSDRNPTEANFNALLPSRPRIVLVLGRSQSGQSVNLKDEKIELLLKSGYRFTNEFCGTMPERLDVRLTSCNLIFEQIGRPQELSANWTGAIFEMH